MTDTGFSPALMPFGRRATVDCPPTLPTLLRDYRTAQIWTFVKPLPILLYGDAGQLGIKRLLIVEHGEHLIGVQDVVALWRGIPEADVGLRAAG
jgi:hypothetical protein